MSSQARSDGRYQGKTHREGDISQNHLNLEIMQNKPDLIMTPGYDSEGEQFMNK